MGCPTYPGTGHVGILKLTPLNKLPYLFYSFSTNSAGAVFETTFHFMGWKRKSFFNLNNPSDTAQDV